MSLAIFFSLVLSGFGEGFRLSFLLGERELADTCQLLKSAGFPSQTASDFRTLVQQHNRKGNRFDASKFPPLTNGYYYFSGVDDFTNRLNYFFYETPGDNSLEQGTLVCFDVAALLLNGAGHRANHVFEDFGSKSIVGVSSEHMTDPVNETNLSRRFGRLFPPEGYPFFLGRQRTEAETRLGVSLTAIRKLTSDSTESDKNLHAIYAEYVALLKKDGFAFPTNYSLGLGLYVDAKRGLIKADHAFICVPKSGRLVTVEKVNSRGPYVRAEFSSESDVALYCSLAGRSETSDPKNRDYGSCVVVALNDRIVGIYRPTLKQ